MSKGKYYYIPQLKRDLNGLIEKYQELAKNSLLSAKEMKKINVVWDSQLEELHHEYLISYDIYKRIIVDLKDFKKSC